MTAYEQALTSIAETYSNGDVRRVSTLRMSSGNLWIYASGHRVGTLSYEFDHDAPGWDKNYIKTDWTFKAIEK